jgi:putative acyl-CoA dehydrogenase
MRRGAALCLGSMTTTTPRGRAGVGLDDSATAAVEFNQPPPLEDWNPARHQVLLEAVRREGAGWAEERLLAFGERVGRSETQRWATQANANPPVLRARDRAGRRLDEVEFHPAWHALLGLAIEHGVHALGWRDRQPGSGVARAGLFFTLSQIESGVGCPLSMTTAAVPALAATPELAAEWTPRFTSTAYDPRAIPASEKMGALCGMAMTERQGGSDVRANITVARPIAADGSYELNGHKWFCSAPMCDAFLVLAQAPAGLSCFLVPRFRPDGARNHLHLQRLKDKLGNRSNASSEIELNGAWGRLLGSEGRGVPTILEMVNHTRLDCALGSAALMRQATAMAIHHCRYRHAFGRPLLTQPLMRNVLADLALESEAATVAAFRLARAFDEADAPFRRAATGVLKYWICKRAVAHVAEALECLGGNGYVEDWGMARLYRESPLNSIWEGSGNVQCLDVLRALERSPEALDALFDEIEDAAEADRHLARWTQSLRQEGPSGRSEGTARRFVERLALALEASLLVRHSPHQVAAAFCASRLGGEGGSALGTLPAGVDLERILERHDPAT